jgi:hypothetical protein
MVTLTTRALERLTDHSPGDGMGWLLSISWDRGDVDKVVAPNGEVSWNRGEPRGWRVDLFGDTLELLTTRTELERRAPRVFVQPWLLPSPSFPGGEVDVDGSELVFRPNAA